MAKCFHGQVFSWPSVFMAKCFHGQVFYEPRVLADEGAVAQLAERLL
jgi:hypothetical protein